MDITRDSGDGSELGSRLVARVLLILDSNPVTGPPGATPLDAAFLPTSVIDSPATVQTSGVDASASSNGSYSNGAYNGPPPATDFGAVANLSETADSETTSFRDTARTPPPHPLIKLLAGAGHVVAWTTRDEWEMDTHEALEHNRPHAVIVEGIAPRDTLVNLCTRLRASVVAKDAGMLAILLPARRNDRARRGLIEALCDAGVDDFLAANAGNAEILAHVRLMANLARTRQELDSAREQLRTQLQTDDQTRLLNRRFFFQAAHRECSRARRYNSELSCLMIEVDHFKRLLGITGFDCCEAMLRAVALVLRELTRDSDIVARFDEEKFAVLLPETTIEGATRLREKIQLEVGALDFSWQGSPVPLSVSGGEANRNREMRAAEEAAQRLDFEDEDHGDHVDGEPLSAREELAELLAAADAALFVARRGVRFPTLVGEYSTEKPTHTLDDDVQQLPSIS